MQCQIQDAYFDFGRVRWNSIGYARALLKVFNSIWQDCDFQFVLDLVLHMATDILWQTSIPGKGGRQYAISLALKT